MSSRRKIGVVTIDLLELPKAAPDKASKQTNEIYSKSETIGRSARRKHTQVMLNDVKKKKLKVSIDFGIEL